MSKDQSASRSDSGETFANGEARFKLGDQWYYRGNRSPSWFYVASSPDGSCQGGISERVEHGSMCRLLDDIAARLAAVRSERGLTFDDGIRVSKECIASFIRALAGKGASAEAVAEYLSDVAGNIDLLAAAAKLEHQAKQDERPSGT